MQFSSGDEKCNGVIDTTTIGIAMFNFVCSIRVFVLNFERLSAGDCREISMVSMGNLEKYKISIIQPLSLR